MAVGACPHRREACARPAYRLPLAFVEPARGDRERVVVRVGVRDRQPRLRGDGGVLMLADLPLHDEELRRHARDREATAVWLIDQTCEHMYSTRDENKFLEVTYAKGDRETFYFKDFSSGAMIENIVARAKKSALKRYLAIREKGLKLEDLVNAVQEEFKENEDLPNTTNPDDWARISGTKGEKIINIRTLVGSKTPNLRPIEDITPGQYL